MPSWFAARNRRSGSPTGSADASTSNCLASSGSAVNRRTKLSSSRPASPPPSTNPNLPVNCVAVNPRGNSSKANGFPHVSAMIRSRTRSSSLYRTAEPSSARASPSRRPCTPRSGRAMSASSTIPYVRESAGLSSEREQIPRRSGTGIAAVGVPSSAARSALRAALRVTASPAIRWVAGRSGRGPDGPGTVTSTCCCRPVCRVGS
jgi:hypothetical protein